MAKNKLKKLETLFLPVKRWKKWYYYLRCQVFRKHELVYLEVVPDLTLEQPF